MRNLITSPNRPSDAFSPNATNSDVAIKIRGRTIGQIVICSFLWAHNIIMTSDLNQSPAVESPKEKEAITFNWWQFFVLMADSAGILQGACKRDIMANTIADSPTIPGHMSCLWPDRRHNRFYAFGGGPLRSHSSPNVGLPNGHLVAGRPRPKVTNELQLWGAVGMRGLNCCSPLAVSQ